MVSDYCPVVSLEIFRKAVPQTPHPSFGHLLPIGCGEGIFFAANESVVTTPAGFHGSGFRAGTFRAWRKRVAIQRSSFSSRPASKLTFFPVTG